MRRWRSQVSEFVAQVMARRTAIEFIAILPIPLLGVLIAFLQYKVLTQQTEILSRQVSLQAPTNFTAEIAYAGEWRDYDAETRSWLKPDRYAEHRLLTPTQLKFVNTGGPAYADGVEVIAFLELVFGNGSDSSCSYLIPMERIFPIVRDTGSEMGLAAELDLMNGSLWPNQIRNFIKNFRSQENDFILFIPTFFVKLSYSDTQGASRAAYFLANSRENVMKIGAIMWRRASEIYEKRVNDNFAIHMPTSANTTPVSNLWLGLSDTEKEKYCRRIGLYMSNDLGGIFLD